ncbi:RluA family pseudouridine synthase [Candidatus Parcubacteria bacterium]|nr:MAG: RluA family pseudouridine synthase [Candidatus Parcubacteria bacterium]
MNLSREPRIIYEDDDIVAVYKPDGLLVHPTSYSREPTLVDWLSKKYPGMKKVGDDPRLRPGIVHRLDKETSGIMLVAKTQNSFDYLKALFAEHTIKKTYLALVSGRVEPSSGIIDKPLSLKSGTVKRTVHAGKMPKHARTVYRVLKRFPDTTLLEVVPETGRTHQIRVHLASIGHPVAGDKLYGGRRGSSGISRLMLHAHALEFSTPRGTRLRLEDPPPYGFFEGSAF